VFAAIFAAAAVLYCWQLGKDSLGASEAYSAWAAAHRSVADIVAIPVLHDPGKQILYYSILHYWAMVAGRGEIALRSLSVLFALAGLLLLFAIGRNVFDDSVAVAGAAIWAFNPTAVIFAHRARMYSMFIAIGLAHLYAFHRVRTRPTRRSMAACAIFGAALLYTHMGSIVVIGAEIAILLRDLTNGRRNWHAWGALAIAVALFAPWAPIAMRQSHALVEGHWLDWIGIPQHYSPITRGAAVAAAAATALWLAFGRRLEDDAWEPIRWCATLAIVPVVAFGAGSIAVRPMFHVRYVAPSLAMAALTAAALLAAMGPRARNLGAAGIAGAMLMLVPVMRPVPQQWQEIAATIVAQDPRWPVFIESGFVAPLGARQVPNRGFPFGYYSIPFDYYFRGSNPRVVVPGFDDAAARATITQRCTAAGGGWLISWKDDACAWRVHLDAHAHRAACLDLPNRAGSGHAAGQITSGASRRLRRRAWRTTH
jgi:4-amino-4-deoxy-L-arabinose transferase-like glycosyltransferase